MFSVTAEWCVSLAFHSFIKIGKYLWNSFIRIILFVLNEEKESTATSSNKNYINDCLKYFPQEINYKEFFTFYRLY